MSESAQNAVHGRPWIRMLLGAMFTCSPVFGARGALRIERWGTLMVISDEWTGRGGGRYAAREDAEPPSVVVLQGERVVASGRLRLDPRGAWSYLWRPPLAASGQLRVVPSYDPGAPGPAQGQSTLCTWRWFDCIPGLPLWAVLIPALVLPRANRAPRALLLLVPVIVVYVGWWAVGGLLPLGPLEYETSRIMVLSPAIGLAVLWLVGRSPAGRTWARSLFGAMAVAAGIVFLGVASLDLNLSDQTIRFTSVMSVLMLALALGHALSRRAYERHPRAWRFVLSLAAWTMAASIVGMFVMITTWCTTYGGWLGDTDYILWLTFFIAPFFGAGVFAMSLLFALVGLRAGFPADGPLGT